MGVAVGKGVVGTAVSVSIGCVTNAITVAGKGNRARSVSSCASSKATKTVPNTLIAIDRLTPQGGDVDSGSITPPSADLWQQRVVAE